MSTLQTQAATFYNRLFGASPGLAPSTTMPTTNGVAFSLGGKKRAPMRKQAKLLDRCEIVPYYHACLPRTAGKWGSRCTSRFTPAKMWWSSFWTKSFVIRSSGIAHYARISRPVIRAWRLGGNLAAFGEHEAEPVVWGYCLFVKVGSCGVHKWVLQRRVLCRRHLMP